MKLRRAIDKRADLQAREYNKSGCARTRDWYHPTTTIGRRRGDVVRAAVKARKGRGKYKMWTGEAIVSTADANPEQAARTAPKCEGASHAHARGCGLYTADLIETRQEDRDQELWRRALDQPLNFYITNNMFDETKLYVAAPGGHRAKRRRTIAHGCQITYKEHACDVQDVDVVRAPALVLRCTAATTAGVVGKPTDQCGIEPHVLPCAPFYGLLTATDSHSVNKKVSKVISQRVDNKKTNTSTRVRATLRNLQQLRYLSLLRLLSWMSRPWRDWFAHRRSPPWQLKPPLRHLPRRS